MRSPDPPPQTPLSDRVAREMSTELARDHRSNAIFDKTVRGLTILAASVVVASSPALWLYGSHLQSEAEAEKTENSAQKQRLALAIATHNESIIFAACRAYHRRDFAAATASVRVAKAVSVYLARHPHDSLANALAPPLKDAASADDYILHFNCHTGMLRAESDSARHKP